MAERLITEILTFAAGLKTKKEKIEYLQANSNRPLRTILKGAFDPTLQFNLPEGEPPYRKDDAPKGLSPSNLHRISRRFKYFNKGKMSLVVVKKTKLRHKPGKRSKIARKELLAEDYKKKEYWLEYEKNSSDESSEDTDYESYTFENFFENYNLKNKFYSTCIVLALAFL